MGAARAAQADVPRRAPGHQDRQGLLRVRRNGEEEAAIDGPEQVRADTIKAAVWSAIAGAAQIAAPFVSGGAHALLTTVGYGLILPVLAVLHLRHAAVRQSGATLATIGGTAVVTIGIAASANAALLTATIFVLGIWWWTVGKMWWETGVVGRPLGLLTMALAVLCFGLVALSLPMRIDVAVAWIPLRGVLGLWLLAVAADLLGGAMRS